MSGRRPSLRRHLASTFTALALVVAIAQAALVYVTGDQSEEAMINDLAAEQLRLSIAQYRRDPALAQPNTPSLRLYVVGDGDTAPLPAFLRGLPRAAGTHEIHPDEDIEYHVAVDRDGDRWFYLVYDVAEHERRQRNVLAVLAISVVAIVLVVLATADRVARRLTADLERLSAAVHGESEARGISGPPGTQFVGLARHAESARLAEALDEYRQRLAEALARERAFSAAASHELRTPLMRATSTVELLQAGDASPQQREKLERLHASLTEITMLTGGLLRVARGTTRGAFESIDLERLAGEVAEHLRNEARARGVEIEIGVTRDAVAHGDRSALWIALVNLLRNAIRHGGATRVRVEWTDGRLRVRDDGRGFDAGRGPGLRSLAAASSEADTAGRDGSLGLGLSIVERVCEAAGWRLTIDSDAATGTRVELDLRSGDAAAPGR